MAMVMAMVMAMTTKRVTKRVTTTATAIPPVTGAGVADAVGVGTTVGVRTRVTGPALRLPRWGRRTPPTDDEPD